jgi:elongation factor P--beta-lysine ligase
MSWVILSRPFGTDRDLPDSRFVFNYCYPNQPIRKANLVDYPTQDCVLSYSQPELSKLAERWGQWR